LEGHSVTVVAPYTGCRGIGHMMGRATAAIQAGVPMDRLPAGHGEIEAGDESE